MTRPNDLVLKEKVLIGQRVPRDFFITTGCGESDITVHAGSYHLALKDAGIEMCNIMTYSSILPSIAREIPYQTSVHGAVMESICAVSTCGKGERATASIIFGWLYDRETGEKYGGLVCEYNGTKSVEESEAELRESLNELYTNGFEERFEIREIVVNSLTVVPEKKFGTALVAICFVNYEVSISSENL
ncbi:MAG: pyruvoyl-dependent arginine decarboxylase [Nanoarchaeota archaeon]|nr:pyruvoyl-dependent arginine decarboxylase [Nanoarchaeota archaeon]